MTRRGDLKLSHGATAKVRENAVKQDRVRVTNAIGHHPERSGFLRRTEFIGGTRARSGDVDRARNGLRAEHFDDLESVGVCCSAPNFDPMDSTDVNR